MNASARPAPERGSPPNASTRQGGQRHLLRYVVHDEVEHYERLGWRVRAHASVHSVLMLAPVPMPAGNPAAEWRP